MTEQKIIKTSMYAYQILGRIDAGLQLCGQEEDGTWQWMGTFSQWQRVEDCELKVIEAYGISR